MRRFLLLLAVLAVPAVSSAQPYDRDLVAEEWETYCDDGTEKVRASLTFYLVNNPVFSLPHAELQAYNGYDCSSYCDIYRAESIDAVGDDNYRVTWEGISRECIIGSAASRWGMLWFSRIDEHGDLVQENPLEFTCTYGIEPVTIIDTVECSPLPVATTTWGAVKALYRAEGNKP
jgi:hypothetical protein